MGSAADYGVLFDALRGVHWPARRSVVGTAAGRHHSRLRGVAPELSEYRPYRQGDEARRIDWKLLARSDRAYIRLADDRSIVPTTIIVDASASMAFPTVTRAKWSQAARLALGLAAVALADGDPVGLLVPTRGNTVTLEARTRRGVLAEMARMLSAVLPAESTSLAPAVRRARRTARLVVLSDFLIDEDSLLRDAREHIAAGGEVHVVHLVSREELEPSSRAVMATDPENPLVTRPLVDATRGEYMSAFAAWRDALARAWRSAGASYTLVEAEEPSERAVRRITATGAPSGAVEV